MPKIMVRIMQMSSAKSAPIIFMKPIVLYLTDSMRNSANVPSKRADSHLINLPVFVLRKRFALKSNTLGPNPIIKYDKNTIANHVNGLISIPIPSSTGSNTLILNHLN